MSVDIQVKNNIVTRAFLIGAGFDRMFNLPVWDELIERFSAFVISNAKTDLRVIFEKIKILTAQPNTPIRRFEMIYNSSKAHGISEEMFIEFLQTALNIDNYTYDEDLKKQAIEAFEKSDSIIITTNFSNVFENLKLDPAFHSKDIQSGKFLPIHGNAFEVQEDIKKIVAFESDYIHNYDKRLALLNSIFQARNISELHIFGYSINDINILSTILKSRVDKIVMYITYSSIVWRDLQKEHFTEFFNGFGKDVVFEEFKIDSSSKGYTESFYKLLQSIAKDYEDESFKNLISDWLEGSGGNNE